MNEKMVRSLLDRLAKRFAEERDLLGELDAAVGDGDHGASMERAYTVARDKVADTKTANDVGALFVAAGNAVMTEVGGASGPLFGSIWLSFGSVTSGKENVTCSDATTALGMARDKVSRLGKSEVGEKTMLDALAAASEALESLEGDGCSIREGLQKAAKASKNAATATAELHGRKGRVRYVENQGKGHMDPGAVSVAIMIEEMAAAAEGDEV